MKSQILLDTGVLVALLSKADQFHQWATATVTIANHPLLTCEAVITEACFLLQRDFRIYRKHRNQEILIIMPAK